MDVFAYEYSGYGHATGKPCEENLYSVRLVRVRVGVRVSPARRTSTRYAACQPPAAASLAADSFAAPPLPPPLHPYHRRLRRHPRP